jgi:hypothetical protein
VEPQHIEGYFLRKAGSLIGIFCLRLDYPKLIEYCFKVAAFPIKIEGTGAGWVRIVAILETLKPFPKSRWALFNGMMKWLTVLICQPL